MYNYIISPIGAVCNYVGGMFFGQSKPNTANQVQTDSKNDGLDDVSFTEDINYTDNASEDSEIKIMSSINCINDYDEQTVIRNEFIKFIHDHKIYDKLNKKNKIFNMYKNIINRNNIKKYVQSINENNININDYDNNTDYNWYVNQVISKYVFSQIISEINNGVNYTISKINNIDESNEEHIDHELYDKSDEMYVLNLNKKYILYRSKVYKNENNSWNIIIN